MKVLLVHNYYRQPGGEDTAFVSEAELLESKGHKVVRYVAHNDKVQCVNPFNLALATLWNQAVYRDLRYVIRRERPDVAHFHNTFPLISPAAYYAAKAEGIPVIQTLHNYRPFCLNGMLFREGSICEKCIGRLPWAGVMHKCYRNSRLHSIGVACLRLLHWDVLRTWQTRIDMLIVPSRFARSVMIRAGLSEERVIVKPNLVVANDLAVIHQLQQRENYAVFVGRLDLRKGIWTLLKAVEKTGIALRIIGDGELLPHVRDWVRQRPHIKVEILGWMSRRAVLEQIGRSLFLVLPSEFHESFGNVIVEAFACGTPVIASRLGAQAELVDDGRTGLLFRPGEPDELAEKMEWLASHPEQRIRMGKEARAEYEAKYTPERNYEMLLGIYERAVAAQLGR